LPLEKKFPAVAKALSKLKLPSTILDGEVVDYSVLHLVTNWLPVFLFFGGCIYVYCRKRGNRNAARFWQRIVKKRCKPSELFIKPTPIRHLPAWQQKLIEEHRLKRFSLNAQPGEVIWTRGSDGALVTELARYWALVVLTQTGQIGYAVYSKRSGAVAHFWVDRQSSQEAMDRAFDWMRYGVLPNRSQ
jgi:hypothetical protein